MKTIEEIRLENLLELRSGFPSERQFAIKLNKSPNQVNQWFGKGAARAIQSDSAREVEVVMSKPRGWLDNDHSHLRRLDGPMIKRTIQRMREATEAVEGEPVDVEGDPDLFAEMLRLSLLDPGERADGNRGVRAAGGSSGRAAGATSKEEAGDPARATAHRKRASAARAKG